MIVFRNIILFSVSLLILLRNQESWDYLLSTIEVDRHSYMIDQQLPIWSYQLCGGISRILDPNSLAYSPLFVFILLFKSFWGLKIIFILSLLIGYYFLNRLLCLYLNIKNSDQLSNRKNDQIKFLSSLFFLLPIVLSSINRGSITFITIMLSFGYLFYLSKAIKTLKDIKLSDFNKVHLKVLLKLSLFIYLCLTADILSFLKLIFIPSMFLVLSILLYNYKNIKNEIFQIRTISIILSLFFGFLLSSYRSFPILENTNLFTVFSFLTSTHYESISLNQSFLSFITLYIPDTFLIFMKSLSITGMFQGLYLEKLSNIFGFFFGLIFIDKVLYAKKDYLSLTILLKFLLGSFLLTIFCDFHLFILFGLGFWCVKQISINEAYNKIFQKSLTAIFLISLISLVSFKDKISLSSLKQYHRYEVEYKDATKKRMNQFITLDKSIIRNMRKTSVFYPYIKQGKGILNCSLSDINESKMKKNSLKTLIKSVNFEDKKDLKKNDSIQSACINRSFYTQNNYFIDKVCPTEVCLNIDSEDIHHYRNLLPNKCRIL